MRRLPLALLLSTACGGPLDITLPVDVDGDHWVDGVDCDDRDADVHPWVDELCDGVDNDCDGEVDEADAIDVVQFFIDADGDGYGDPDSVVSACEAPSGYVETGDDCDDTDASVLPGAIEICDEVDNDCDGDVDEPGALGPVTWYRDNDGDGYGDPDDVEESCAPSHGYVEDNTDCDDSLVAVNPGAQERCDAFDTDEDCDGLADDDDPDVDGTRTYYADADGDSFGDEAIVYELCDQPDDSSTRGGDCDDTERQVNPAAEEKCGDVIDNDCDGLIDGADEAVDVGWYTDADADGHGDPDAYWGDACDDPGGLSVLSDDCDDADAASYPDATEVWYDGVDQDCAGDSDFDADRDGFEFADFGGTDCDDADDDVRPDQMEICGDGVDNDCDGVVDACDVAAVLEGEAAGDRAGASVAGAGDVDGDGIHDILVGADRSDLGGAGAGAAYLLSGPVSGGVLSDARAVITGEDIGDHAGFAVAGAGDLNGDGYDDIVVGAYDSDAGGVGSGAAYLLHGPVRGTTSLGSADARLAGEDAGDQSGSAVAGAGDTDGDGYADVLIGAWAEDEGGADAGAAYLFAGPVTGRVRLWTADLKLVGEDAGDQAGYSVSGAGDVDGDGLNDVVVGAPYEHSSGAYLGAIYLVLGGQLGTLDLSAADARRTGQTAGDQAGYAVAGGGDIDGDGYDDLLIGAPENDAGGGGAGAVYLLRGPISGDSGLSGADAVLVGEDNDDNAGCSLAMNGDLDGDGAVDLLIGARLDDSAASDAGAAYLLLGVPSGTVDLSAADGKILGEASGDWLGDSVSMGGDVDGDGIDDALVGVPAADTDAGVDAGSVWVMLGGGWP